MTSPSRSTEAPSAFNERQFRDAMARLATGVTIVCARAGEGRFVGFTANSFGSVSLDPPLVVWNLAARSASLAAFESARTLPGGTTLFTARDLEGRPVRRRTSPPSSPR